MEKFFHFKKYGTKPAVEIIAGLTTFFAMAYIIFVNPEMLSQTGMPKEAVFLATIIASAVGTLIMGLYANVPYATAPGMGLNAFFTFVICFGLGYTWQQALAMVFICGIINIIITVTKLRKTIIISIPDSLKNAIGGGIWIFIAYIGIKNMGLLSFASGVPELVALNTPSLLLAIFGIILMAVLVVRKVKGGIFLAILWTTLVSIIFALCGFSTNAEMTAVMDGTLVRSSVGNAFSQLWTTFLAAFSSAGIGSLFSNRATLPIILMTIFSLCLSDTFDTIGTFIGTGRKSWIFDDEDYKALTDGSGLNSRMDKALFADSIATSIGAVFGTSNTTTYVESAAGIGAGGRTGLTSVVIAVLFLLSIILAPVLNFVPTEATSPALIIVGIMMLSSFINIKRDDIAEAIPSFFVAIFMALAYNISYGIGAGFIFYCIVKLATGKAKEIHPVIWVSAILFILNFVVLAIV